MSPRRAEPPRPLVGINYDFIGPVPRRSGIYWLDAGYIDALEAAGADVRVLLPHEAYTEKQIAKLLAPVDAAVLIGGADLDSRRDGFRLHPAMRLLHPRREVFDRLLVRVIAERRLPVLAIGVGMQLVNVSQGGALSLHIPDDYHQPLAHWSDDEDPCRHGLSVEPGSFLDALYHDTEPIVHSAHHQAVDDVAAGFRATAWALDGVIEAIESTREEWFAVGVQWHPEAGSASQVDRLIFREFLAKVRERMK